jgi:hypothetical protein
MMMRRRTELVSRRNTARNTSKPKASKGAPGAAS